MTEKEFWEKLAAGSAPKVEKSRKPLKNVEYELYH